MTDKMVLTSLMIDFNMLSIEGAVQLVPSYPSNFEKTYEKVEDN